MDLKGTIWLKISVAFIVIRNVYCQAPTCFTSEQYFSGYRPEQSVTETGFSCERWDELTELITDTDFVGETLGEAANFCRNPDQSLFYWCYAVPESEKYDCFDTTSADYTGTRNVTISGHNCQRWDVTTPNSHAYKDSTVFPGGSSTAAKNYCRDPDGLGTPWCFSLHPDVRWEECDIKKCKDLKDRVRKTTCGIELCGPVSSGCPRGWTRSGGGKTCYTVSGSRVTWEQAVSTCESADAKLLEVNEEVEYHFLVNSLLKDEKDTFWMGLTDQVTEGSFVLRSSGKSPNFTDWFPGQPDDFFKREDCVDMYLSKKDGYKWRDDDCDRENNYICETKADAVAETTVEPNTQETSGQTITEDTTVVTTITSGCKQPFAFNLMAAVLAMAVHICYLVL